MKVRTRLAWFLTCIFLVLETSFAAPSKEVSYKSGDETVKAIRYAPAGKGPFPGIVVIHEWWGLNDRVKEQASKLADQGYAALAIDLYRGKVATMPALRTNSCAVCLRIAALRDLHAAVQYLKSQPNIKKDRIGSIGWCMGGGFPGCRTPGTGANRHCHQLWSFGDRSGCAQQDQCCDSRKLCRKGSGYSCGGR